MKWISFTDKRPSNGQYCLCKKEHGCEYTQLFFATYWGGAREGWDDHDGLHRGVFFVDFWMYAYKLDMEARDAMYRD